MVRRTTILIIVISLISLSYLSAEESEDLHLFQLSRAKKFPLDYKIEAFYPLVFFNGTDPANISQSYDDYTFTTDNRFKSINDPTTKFSLAKNDLYSLSFTLSPDIYSSLVKDKKAYRKTAFEITGMNVGLWAFNKYFLKKAWARISFKTVLWNLKHGPAWDYDDFLTNQFMHPYHGAIHYCTARANGFNFVESASYAFMGSLMWEFILESVGTKNNPPSTNDLILNTSGGALLGEALFRFSHLIIDGSSEGFERVLRESLAFFINPAYGFKFFSGEAFRKGNPPKNHYYNLSFPWGADISSFEEPAFIISANLEYRDFLNKDFSSLNPYDWFSFKCRFGFRDSSLRDKEWYTMGILAGGRLKNGIAGLFGVFDYIDTHIADQLSAVGLGPGFVTVIMSDSDLFFNSSGVLSLILGASSPSIEPEDYHFGKKTNEPYYLGPGMLGRIKLELGKKGFGSIGTGFSQYWVSSIFYNANEFMSILSFDLKCDVSDNSQISFGYDYYLRRGKLYNQNFTGGKPALRALYILKF